MLFRSAQLVKNLPDNAGNPGWIPGMENIPGEGIGYPLQYAWASLVAQWVKNPPVKAEDLSSISGSGRSPSGVAFQAPPGSQASSRGEAKDSALLSSRDAALLEPPERPHVDSNSGAWPCVRVTICCG